MTINEAKEILLIAQLGREDSNDPQLKQAMDLLEQHPELSQWLEQQRATQTAIQRRLRGIPIPAGLRDKILIPAKIIRPSQWWNHPLLWSAAAMLMFVIGFSFWLSQSRVENTLTTFRGRMVGAVLRQYTMDIKTNDMSSVRAFLASKNAPADYTLPDKLNRLPVSGGGILSWQGQKVSMVCLDSLRQGTLFLFIVDGSSLNDGHLASHEFQQVNKLGTVTWNTNGKTYVLAGTGGADALEQYF